MPGKMGKGYRSRQVHESEAPEHNWRTHSGKESSGSGEKGYYRETGCDQKFYKKGGGDPKPAGDLTFDRPGPDIYSEGRMPERHTSKDN